jgi:hypothetical protein
LFSQGAALTVEPRTCLAGIFLKDLLPRELCHEAFPDFSQRAGGSGRPELSLFQCQQPSLPFGLLACQTILE